MTRAALAGAAYGLVLFGLSFGLGALRVMVVAPRIGVVAATALEAVPMLAAMAWVAPRLAHWQALPPRGAGRIAMGGIALALLVGVEIGLGAVLNGATPDAWVAKFATPEGMIYGALLLAFAAMPWLRA
ncbi:hypothetical protein [Plastoroseomonas arctica]|uniref:Uncharacterized protein n=1 Tax=Plastoroseomonas arctica TaxID=1509237 RepID=A0AAF1KSP0_9PROT|nr:hypothetical protein [Plastoroseomonas arctica]MBR0654927.1 hypothetical protein [Plastoroseomonas arctica]